MLLRVDLTSLFHLRHMLLKFSLRQSLSNILIGAYATQGGCSGEMSHGAAIKCYSHVTQDLHGIRCYSELLGSGALHPFSIGVFQKNALGPGTL